MMPVDKNQPYIYIDTYNKLYIDLIINRDYHMYLGYFKHDI